MALDSSCDRQTRDKNYDLYRRTRRNALALWWETVNATAAVETRGSIAARDGVPITSESWPEGGEDEGGAPCLLWCSGSWHCSTASWCIGPEKKEVKVSRSLGGGIGRGAHFSARFSQYVATSCNTYVMYVYEGHTHAKTEF